MKKYFFFILSIYICYTYFKDIGKEDENMAIHYKGKLQQEKLQQVDISDYHKIQFQVSDYALSALILIFPILCSLKLLILPYTDSITNILIGDMIGLLIVVILMCLHEYFHAITFSKNQDVTIWYKGFIMMTYCIEEKAPLDYIKTFLLPNIFITLPIMLLTIFFYFYPLSAFYMKIYGLMSAIIILGSYNDFTYVFFLLKNKKCIKKYD